MKILLLLVLCSCATPKHNSINEYEEEDLETLLDEYDQPARPKGKTK